VEREDLAMAEHDRHRLLVRGSTPPTADALDQAGHAGPADHFRIVEPEHAVQRTGGRTERPELAGFRLKTPMSVAKVHRPHSALGMAAKAHQAWLVVATEEDANVRVGR
jgi:hypothetical protein